MTIKASLPEFPATPLLEVALRQHGGVCVMALSGELCAASLHLLEAEFDRLGCTSCQQVVLDLTALSAIDEPGGRVLTGLHHYVNARGGRLSMAGANDGVLDVLAESPIIRFR